MKRNDLIFIIIFVFSAAAAVAFLILPQTKNTGKVTITEATASPMHGTQGAVIVALKLKNEGPPQTIIAVRSPDAKQSKIHGVEGSENLAIPADTNAAFSKDGAHLILMGVDGELADGRLFTIKLELEPAGSVTTKARFSISASSGHGGHQMTVENSEHSQHSGMQKHPGMYAVPAEEPQPSIKVSVERVDGSAGWRVLSEVEDFQFNRELADGAHKPGNGHGHLYLNGLKLGRVYEPAVDFGWLPKGRHRVRVTLNTNNHQTYMVDGKPVSATTDIVID